MQDKPDTGRLDKNRNFLEWVDSIVLAVVFVALVFTFVARVVRVDGRSMNPTLQDQQRLIVSDMFFSGNHGSLRLIHALRRSVVIA